MDDELKLCSWTRLKEIGWPYSRTHTMRLCDSGEFPKPRKLVDHRNAHPIWLWGEIADYLRRKGLDVH